MNVMPAIQQPLGQPTDVESLAQRSGYDPACLKQVALAAGHVRALFLGTDGKTPIPELQTDPAFALRCYNRAYGHVYLLWKAVETGDAAQTHTVAQAWYKAVREAIAHERAQGAALAQAPAEKGA